MTSHSQIKAVLVRARNLIADPKHWTRWDFRRRVVRGVPDVPEAFAYCAVGAIQQAANLWENDPVVERDETGYVEAEQRLRRTLRERTGNGGVTQFNDTHSHEEVLDLFNAAIEREAELAAQEVKT